MFAELEFSPEEAVCESVSKLDSFELGDSSPSVNSFIRVLDNIANSLVENITNTNASWESSDRIADEIADLESRVTLLSARLQLTQDALADFSISKRVEEDRLSATRTRLAQLTKLLSQCRRDSPAVTARQAQLRQSLQILSARRNFLNP